MRPPLLFSLRLEDVGCRAGVGKGLGFKAGPAAIVPSFRGLGEVGPGAIVPLFCEPVETEEAAEAGVCTGAAWYDPGTGGGRQFHCWAVGPT